MTILRLNMKGTYSLTPLANLEFLPTNSQMAGYIILSKNPKRDGCHDVKGFERSTNQVQRHHTLLFTQNSCFNTQTWQSCGAHERPIFFFLSTPRLVGPKMKIMKPLWWATAFWGYPTSWLPGLKCFRPCRRWANGDVPAQNRWKRASTWPI